MSQYELQAASASAAVPPPPPPPPPPPNTSSESTSPQSPPDKLRICRHRWTSSHLAFELRSDTHHGIDVLLRPDRRCRPTTRTREAFSTESKLVYVRVAGSRLLLVAQAPPIALGPDVANSS